MWNPLLKWVTTCSLDLTYFPIDRQKCTVILMNWTYGSGLVNFTVVPSGTDGCVDTSNYQRSSDWNLISTSCSYDSSDNGQVPLVLYTFELQRVSIYFVLNIIIPTICLSILSVMVFRMPPEAGEKMGLSVTVLMSYSVILMIMSDNVPRSSKLPIISESTKSFIAHDFCCVINKSSISKMLYTVKAHVCLPIIIKLMNSLNTTYQE